MQLLICCLEGTSAAAKTLERFLTKQGYQVVVADTVQQAVIAAQTHKPTLAFLPATADQATETMELMQKLSLLGIPSVLINAEGAGYSAAEDKALARALSRFARRASENGNGHRH